MMESHLGALMRSSLFVVVMASVACSSSIDSSSPQLAAALEIKVEEHDDVCQRASTPTEIDEESERYERDVREWSDEAAGCATMMGMQCCCCGRSGDDVADDAVREVEEHRRAITAADDVEEAREECRTHRSRMKVIIDDASAGAPR